MMIALVTVGYRYVNMISTRLQKGLGTREIVSTSILPQRSLRSQVKHSPITVLFAFDPRLYFLG